VTGTTSGRIWLGAAAATAAVVLFDLAGGLDGLNERLLDLQQQWLPRRVEPMSTEIVMVDIDDRALERLGRWPWPRSHLAGAIDELHRAGARTIAVDLDLADPQAAEWLPGPPPHPVDHDAALAESISPRVVLGALLMPDELPVRWRAAGGTEADLAQTLLAMRTDPDLDPREASELGPSARGAAAQTLHLLRRHLLYEGAAPSADRDQTVEGGNASMEAIRPILEAVRRQQDARASLQGLVDHPGESASPPTAGDRFPLPALAAASGGTGYVNIVRRSHDGGIRHLEPLQPVGHGEAAPPLGIAAAMLHQRHGDAVLQQHAFHIGDLAIPITDGAFVVCWPRGSHGMQWPDLHRRDDTDDRFTGHLSISEVVLLASQRASLRRNAALRRDRSRDLLRSLRQQPDLEVADWLDPALQREIAEEVAWDLDGIDALAQLHGVLKEVPEQERGRLEQMFQWREATRLAKEGAAAVSEVESSLRDHIEDKLVFVGWTATGTLADFVPTAAGPRTPGVMVHAAAADMVLQRRVLDESPVRWSPLIAAAFGLLVAFIVSNAGPWTAAAAALVAGLVWCAAIAAAFRFGGLVLPASAPLIAIAASWATGTGGRAVMTQREKRRIARQFRARVPEPLVDELARDPDAVSMRGVRREVCVMFGDLAGFTTISERLDTEATVALLNRCMTALTAEVTSHGAYLNKFLGDGFLAFWSAFHEQEDQAREACAAALACQKVMARINADPELSEPSIGLRIGIATGEALVGDCGAPPNLNDYTVIGDVANLASRLESANKQTGTSILLDGRTSALADDENLPLVEIGPLQVVGREGVVNVWTLDDSSSQEARSAASELADAIRSGDRVAARAALEAAERIQGSTARTRLAAEVIRDTPDPMPHAIRLREK